MRKHARIYRIISGIIYPIVAILLCLNQGFWKGLALFGILLLFGWAMNLENNASIMEKGEK